MKKIIHCPLVKRALALGLMLYGLGAYGATYHVATTGDDATADGTNPETPYASVHAALGVAAANDVILIGGGTFSVTNAVLDRALTLRGAGRDMTTLKGPNTKYKTGLTISAAGVTVADMTLSGFSPKQNVNGVYFSGGAIYMTAESVVTNCHITANRSNYSGQSGAVYMTKGLLIDSVIDNNYINDGAPGTSNNYSLRGAGIHITGGEVRGCLISHNTNSYLTANHNNGTGANNASLGGGVYMTGGKLVNCTVADNWSAGFGGNVYVSGTTARIENCVITGGRAYVGDSDIFQDFYPASATNYVVNSIIGGSSADHVYRFGSAGLGGDYNLTEHSSLWNVGYQSKNSSAFACGITASRRVVKKGEETVLSVILHNAPTEPSDITWVLTAPDSTTITLTGDNASFVPGQAGVYDVALSVTAGGETVTATRNGWLTVAPESLSVTTGDDIHSAVAQLTDGCVLNVSGTISVTKPVELYYDITVVGEGRDATTVKNTKTSAGQNRVFDINSPGAVVKNLKITGGVINNNYSTGAGARIGLRGGRITNCAIVGNKVTTSYGSGGGVAMYGEGAMLDHCIISNNIAKQDAGAGVILRGGTIDNCLIVENVCDLTGSNKGCLGGGVYLNSTTAKISNSTIARNKWNRPKGSFTTSGGGIYYASAPAAGQIVNTIIVENEALAETAYGGADIAGISEANLPKAQTAFVNCAFETCGAIGEGGVKLEVTPFKDAANGDYSPVEGSGVIDRGAKIDEPDATDLAGDNRAQGFSQDIGAYEYPAGIFSYDIASSVTNGYERQRITLSIVGDVEGIPTGTPIVWTVDGEVVEGSSASIEIDFEVGVHSVCVNMGGGLWVVEKENFITLTYRPGVDFSVTEKSVVAGAKYASLSVFSVGGLELNEGAVCNWYWTNDGSGEPDATGRVLEDVRFGVGTWNILLKVENADGNGMELERRFEEAIIVEPPVINLSASITSGEGRTVSTLSAEAVGFEFNADAEYEWYWMGGETLDATGNPVNAVFKEGSWTVKFVAKNIDGTGLTVTNTLASVIDVAPGADFYVSRSGNDEGYGTKASPYATLKAALDKAEKGDKIKIVGTVTLPNTTADLQLTVSGVELFGDGSDKSCLDFDETKEGKSGYLKLTEGAFVHNLKLYRSRNTGGVIRIAAGESDVVVSNCWIDTCNYSTRGQPGGSFSDGLVTHTLFSGNNCNFGPVFSIGGNAKVRNCIFTRNSISSSRTDTNPRYGIFYLSDSALFENNTVYGNYASYNANYPTDVYSAGLYISGGSPTIRNNIVSYNFIHGDIGSATAVESNYLCKNGATPVATHNASSEGFGENAVTVPPTFANLDMSLAAENRNFALAEGSSCIDAGLFQDWHLTATDYSGAARFQGQGVEIGAFEVDAPIPHLAITADKPEYRGAQTVTLTAASDNEVAFADATTFLWTVDGEELEETSAVLAKHFESGTYEITATSRRCSYFTASFTLVVKEVPGVVFDIEETAGVGRKSVKVTPRGSGGLTLSDQSTYAWYINDQTGAGEPVSTEKSPTLELGSPGTHYIFLRVSNADGEGAVYEKLRVEGIVVETPVVGFELSDTTGEGRTAIELTATCEGFEPHADATFEWRWTDLESENPDITGQEALGIFYPGTYSVRLILKNADGNGFSFTNTLVNAVTVAPGADFYVSRSGNDEGYGTKASPYATLKAALGKAEKGDKIKIVGTVSENFAYTLKGVELFGDGPTESVLQTAGQFAAYLTLTEGATVHGLKISGSRNTGGVLRIPAGEDSSSVSNCWLSGNNYSTAGNPGGGFSAGLVTHSLFSGNSCNYGPVVSAGGTAKIRNCIFTGNYIKDDGSAQNRLGVVQLAGSAVFENNTVYGNYSQKTVNTEQHSAGLYVSGGSPAIRNNIVSYNFIHGDIGSETAVESNYLCKDGATPVATHNASSEGFGEAAVTERPVFANLDMSLAAEERDFALSETSPCIDRGMPLDWLPGAVDFAGNPRVSGWGVDLGAYEVQTKALQFDVLASASVVTGAQNIAFMVTGDTQFIPEDADIRWFVDGEEVEVQGANVSIPLEEGRHDITVNLGGYFTVEKKEFVWVKTPRAVVIDVEEVQGNGKKTVTFNAVARGFDFADTAQFAWYYKATGEGEIDATGNPVVKVFKPGTYDVFVRVSNADEHGATYTTNILSAVTVPEMSAEIRLSTTIGEVSKSVALSAEPTGFAIEPPAVCTWEWTRAEDGATGTLTGNPAIGVFTTGTYAFSLEITNADGEGAVVTASLASGALKIYAAEDVTVPSGQGSTSIYLDQLQDLPFKTINGRPITGSGEMTVVSSDSYRAVEDVSDYGAIGDGKTDDTAAIMAALDAAYSSGKPLYFPKRGPNTVYLTRKGLILLDGLTITSDPGVTLASASAVLEGAGQTISIPVKGGVEKGATSFNVDQVAGLVVGQEITLWSAGSYTETLADITAIDEDTKTVYIDTSRYTASGRNEGFLRAEHSSLWLFTDFALIKSILPKSAVNCTIENITLKPYGNKSDPYIYTISPINQTKQTKPQNTLRIRNVTIDGATHDGISAQGSGDIWIENCTVKDVKHKGIHWGTSCDKIVVRGNLCLRCGSAEYEKVSNNGGTGAMYFCVNNHRVIIEGNRIVDCYKGVFGFDFRGNGETDTDSIVANNIFENCTYHGVSPYGMSGTGYQLNITGNHFRRFTGTAVPICFKSGSMTGSVISGNVFGDFQDDYRNLLGAIAVSNANGVVISGNVIERNPSAIGSTDIVIENSKNVAVSGNVVDGRVNDSNESNENVIKTGNVEINGEVR